MIFPAKPHESALPLLARCKPLAMTGAALLCVTSLGGCHHRDAVDTAYDLYRQAEGGEIAKQHAPPPGENLPYPNIGLTPSTPPTLPSPELRHQITQELLGSRNLTTRTAAENGSLFPEIPPLPGVATTPTVTDQASDKPQQMSATLDAAESSPTNTGTQTKPIEVPVPAVPPSVEKKTPAPAAKADIKQKSSAATQAPTTENEISLPAFQENQTTQPTPAGQIPEIPAAPPPASVVSGMTLPSDASLPDPMHPAYDLSVKSGTYFHFLPESDQLSPGQEGELAKLAQQQHAGSTLWIHGYGGATGMTSADQTKAINLGILRARTIANALIKLNTPASALRIQAEAFGSGARVSTSAD